MALPPHSRRTHLSRRSRPPLFDPRVAPRIGVLAAITAITVLAIVIGLTATTASAWAAAQGTISGTVTDAKGKPLAGICIDAFGADDANFDESDAQGRYSIKVAPGDYKLNFYGVDCTGDASPYVSEWWNDKPTEASANVVKVTSGATRSGIDAAMSTGATISGTVRGRDGAPLADICVDTYARDESPLGSTVTDAQGAYTVGGGSPGQAFAQFYDCGDNGVVGEWWDNQTTLAAATPIQVGVADIKGIDVTLNGGQSISGTVTDESGSLLEGVCVTAYDLDEQAVSFATTDELGEYAARGLASGRYRMEYADCDEQGLVGEWWKDQPSFERGNVITVASADIGGANVSLARSLVADETAPDTTITQGPDDGATVASDRVTLRFTASPAGDAAGFECQVDSGVWSACESPLTLTGLADGRHSIAVRAFDLAGNMEDDPATLTFTVDTTVVDDVAPDTEIGDGPADGAVLASSAASFRFTGTPGDTVAFDCQVDGGAWSECVSPRRLSGLGEGAHSFGVRAKDAAGNLDASPAARSFTVDLTAPDTSITSGPSAGARLTQGSTSFGFVSTESGADFECRLDDGVWDLCSPPKNLSGLSDGSHTFAVRALDALGNTDASPASRTFRVTAAACASARSKVTSGQAKVTKTIAAQTTAKAKAKTTKAKVKKAKKASPAIRAKLKKQAAKAAKSLKAAKANVTAAKKAVASAQAQQVANC